MSSKDKYAQIKNGTYSNPESPVGKYNTSFSVAAERDVGQTLGFMIPESEESWDKEDSAMTARMFIDGLWLNKSEEIGSWIAAGAYKLFNGAEESVGQIRDEMLGTLEAESAQFMDERPGAAISANIVGSILSPASLKAGQLLSQANRIRQSNLARQSSQNVTSVLGPSISSVSDDSARLAQQLSGFGPRAYNIAARTPAPLLGAGLAAGESAVVGFEGENLEESLKNAGKSAVLGGVFSSAISGVGYGVNKALKSNIAQQVGQGTDFVGLMFTDHLLSPVYRHVVSKSFGAKSFMEQQARRITSRIPSVDDLKTKKTNLVENAKKRIAQAQRIIGSEKEEAIERAKLLADEVADDLKAGKAIEEADLDSVSQSRIEGLRNSAELDIDNIKANAVKEADEAVNALEGGFRSKVYSQSLPANTPQDEVLAVQALGPQDALQEIDRLWAKYGFNAADGQSINVDSQKILSDISAIIKSKPARVILEGSEPGTLADRVSRYLDEVLKRELNGATSGAVAGEVLMGARSSIGRLINNLSEDKLVTKEVLDPIQDYLDDLIRNSLKSKQARDAFDADRAVWRTKSTLEDAASLAATRRSAFTADDWIKANKKQSARQATRGSGVLQRDAEELNDLVKRRDNQIKEVANQSSRRARKESLKRINEEQSILAQKKKQLSADLQQRLRDVRRDYAQSAKTARDKAKRDEAVAKAREDFRLNTSDIDSQIEKIEASKRLISEILPSSDPSIFERLFATSLLLSAVGGVFVPAAGAFGAGLAVGGVGLARGLSAEGTQRFLAGQTAAQQAGGRFADRLASSVSKLAERYGINVPSSIAATVGESAREGMVFGEESKRAIMRAGQDRQAQVYSALLNNGRIELVKRQDAELYRALKSAYDSQSR